MSQRGSRGFFFRQRANCAFGTPLGYSKYPRNKAHRSNRVLGGYLEPIGENPIRLVMPYWMSPNGTFPSTLKYPRSGVLGVREVLQTAGAAQNHVIQQPIGCAHHGPGPGLRNSAAHTPCTRATRPGNACSCCVCRGQLQPHSGYHAEPRGRSRSSLVPSCFPAVRTN